MNELLQKHGCSNVFSLPEGLKELMSDISREVLRAQPPMLYEFIANYLSALLITREHGILAVRILDDLCDCRPTVTEHLYWMGIGAEDVKIMAEIIKKGIEGKPMYEAEMVPDIEVETEGSEETEPEEGSETVREMEILKLILEKVALDEPTCAKVCQVIRNAYRDYWYRKKLLEKELKLEPETPWEIAAEHTLELYKKTKPSLTELNRASERIQAAYKGYHVRKNILAHLKKPKVVGPKRELPGPPLDIADSREIDLGDVIKLQVNEDNVSEMFVKKGVKDLGLRYDPMKALALDETVKKTTVKIQSRTDSTITIYEGSRDTLTTAQQTVKDLIFTPKASTKQFQMSNDLFLSPLPSRTEQSEQNLIVVVPPKKYDSVCMCEEDLADPDLSQTNVIFTEGASGTPKAEGEAQRCLRQTASETKKVSIASQPARSGMRLEPKEAITPRSSPTDTASEKGPEEDKATQLAPGSEDVMQKNLSFAEAPSGPIIADEPTAGGGEEKDKLEPVVVQTMEMYFRPPLLSPIHVHMPPIPEVDEKASTASSNPSDPSSTLSDPSSTTTVFTDNIV